LNVQYKSIIISIDKKVEEQIFNDLSTNFQIKEDDQKSIDDICKLVK